MEDYQKKLIEIVQDVVKNGFGEVRIVAEEVLSYSKEKKVKVVIKAGKHYVFFLAKEMKTPPYGENII